MNKNGRKRVNSSRFSSTELVLSANVRLQSFVALMHFLSLQSTSNVSIPVPNYFIRSLFSPSMFPNAPPFALQLESSSIVIHRPLPFPPCFSSIAPTLSFIQLVSLPSKIPTQSYVQQLVTFHNCFQYQSQSYRYNFPFRMF